VTGLPGDAVDVQLGWDHACVLVNAGASIGGAVYCWGANYAGQLGQGYTQGYNTGRPEGYQGSSTPLLVEGLDHVTALYAGDENTCALTAAERVMCWGGNRYGMLGVGYAHPEKAYDAVVRPTAMLQLCV
jgi:alpha-tubulin suppressor-like RCC1 family protein